MERKIYKKVLTSTDIEPFMQIVLPDNNIGNVERGKWIHMTVFIREGYIASQHPCVAVWVDGELRLMSRIPNAYNTIMGSYFKMGMYKTAWAYTNTETTSRIVYYDNINIWQ